MRFLNVLLLGVFLIFSLAACGGNGDGSGDTDADLQTVEDNGVQLELLVEVQRSRAACDLRTRVC